MELEEAFETLQNYVNEDWIPLLQQAIDTIRAATKKRLQTTNSKQSAPCFHSMHRGTSAKIIYCEKCGAVIG